MFGRRSSGLFTSHLHIYSLPYWDVLNYVTAITVFGTPCRIWKAIVGCTTCVGSLRSLTLHEPFVCVLKCKSEGTVLILNFAQENNSFGVERCVISNQNQFATICTDLLNKSTPLVLTAI